MSAKDAIYSLFKYLTAWQIVALLIYWFIQTYWDSTWEAVLAIWALVILFMWIYYTNAKFKVTNEAAIVEPTEEATLTKAINIIGEHLGIDFINKKDEQIELLKKLCESQAEKIAQLEKERDG